jgi:hypothetical protein
MSTENVPSTQVFDHSPDDRELAHFLDPKADGIGLRVEESEDRLVAAPGGISMWLLVFSLAIPTVAIVGYWIYKATHEGLKPMDVAAMMMMCLALPATFAIFWGVSRKIQSTGDYFVLDKHRRELTLPRLKLTISREKVLQFVELRAWHTEKNKGNRETTWLAELSVLVRNDDSNIARYPVAVSRSTGRVSRLGNTLADAFRVELRRLHMNYKMRKKLAADNAAKRIKRPE